MLFYIHKLIKGENGMTVKIIIGKTFSGKTTFMNRMIEKGLCNPVIWTTTRPIRDGEVDGVDYYFEDDEYLNVDSKPDYIIESYNVFQDGKSKTWRYSLFLEDLLTIDNPVVIIDINELTTIIDYLDNEQKDFNIVYIDTPEEEILRRVVDSDRSGEELIETMRRLLDDTRKYLFIEEMLDNEGLLGVTYRLSDYK